MFFLKKKPIPPKLTILNPVTIDPVVEREGERGERGREKEGKRERGKEGKRERGKEKEEKKEGGGEGTLKINKLKKKGKGEGRER